VPTQPLLAKRIARRTSTTAILVERLGLEPLRVVVPSIVWF